MNGYLMQEQLFVAGQDCFIESFVPENNYGVVFEDDGETGYFYAVEKDPQGPGLKVLDALHIYEVGESAEDEVAGQPRESTQDEVAGQPVESTQDEVACQPGEGDPAEDAKLAGTLSKLLIVWSKDWMKCALIINGFCHAIFDFKAQGGYNINEFPPPNDIWTQGDRKLTDELVKSLF